jgi:hypothetical protein
MMPCDSGARPMLASVRKRKKMLSKNYLSFSIIPILTPPPPTTPSIADDFDSRLGAHDVGNDCSMTVDGTNFCILQKGIAKKGNAFAPHKCAGKSTLQHELGVDIQAGNLVWIRGPNPAGKYTNIQICNMVLRHFLEPGERVEANEGYHGHAGKKNARETTQIRWRRGQCRGG